MADPTDYLREALAVVEGQLDHYKKDAERYRKVKDKRSPFVMLDYRQVQQWSFVGEMDERIDSWEPTE